MAADELAAGHFLEEHPYVDWAIHLREEARATAVAVARALAEGAAAHDAPDVAVHHFLRVLEVDPYDEPGHLSLVRTLRTSGGHGEARRQYRVYPERMSELGVEPAPFPSCIGCRQATTAPAHSSENPAPRKKAPEVTSENTSA